MINETIGYKQAIRYCYFTPSILNESKNLDIRPSVAFICREKKHKLIETRGFEDILCSGGLRQMQLNEEDIISLPGSPCRR